MSAFDHLLVKIKRDNPNQPAINAEHGFSEGEHDPVMLDYAENSKAVKGPLTGPRGRNLTGQPMVIAPGLPPSLEPGGFGSLLLLDKDTAHVPYNMESVLDIPMVGAGLVILDRQFDFPIRGMQIDNLSNQWLFVEGAARRIQPWTTGCCFPIFKAPNKLKVISEAPPGFTQAGLTAGTSMSVWCYEDFLAMSPGTIIPATFHP